MQNKNLLFFNRKELINFNLYVIIIGRGHNVYVLKD